MPESERGERHELIEGEFLVTPAPVWKHQRIIGKLFRIMDDHAESMRLGWVNHDVGVYLDERTYVVPDLVFVSCERRGIIGEANVEGAPDLVCEIHSPSTRSRDQVTKRALYARIGVREYWQPDPVTQTVSVLALEPGGHVEIPLNDDGTIMPRVRPDLQLTRAQVFEDMDTGPRDVPAG